MENNESSPSSSALFRHYSFDLQVKVSSPLYQHNNNNIEHSVVVGIAAGENEEEFWSTKLSCNLG